MKTNILGAFVVVFMVSNTYAQQDDAPITQSQLPVVVSKNVGKYFGKKPITQIVKDSDDGRVTYDIYFEDGSEAEFSNNGSLKEAKSYSGLSNAIIPARIRTYVSKYFSGASIVKWERGINRQEVELSNGIELDFDLKGRFLRKSR